MSLRPEQIKALEAPLDRSHVKGRKQAGREVNYIESWHAESEANRIFGFDGWDSKIKDLRLVSEREVVIGKGSQYEKPGWSVSYICTVAVVVFVDERGPVVREGVGAGHGIDADPGQAHESAVKEAASDAEKRALKTWGSQFGLALYDKTQTNVADAPPPPRPEETGVYIACKAAIDVCGQDRAALDAWGKGNSASMAKIEKEQPSVYRAVKSYYSAKLKAAQTADKPPPSTANDFGLQGDDIPAFA